QQQLGGHCQRGIVAGVSVAEYESGRIRRHELTRADKERERTRHIDTVGAQTGPLFLVHRGGEAVAALTARTAETRPEIAFTAPDGVV
ncbi:DUF1015 family protein, partial [Enterococcus faecium]|uniref:DUF1015 family protein n=1 Tax=Enterococcus faecium TaxID=1352 RepID=UPI003F4445F5